MSVYVSSIFFFICFDVVVVSVGFDGSGGLWAIYGVYWYGLAIPTRIVDDDVVCLPPLYRREGERGG